MLTVRRSVACLGAMLSLLLILSVSAKAAEHADEDYIDDYFGAGLTQIIFSASVPNSVFRTVVVPVGGADVEIFLQDCCIRDDVVEVHVVNGCKIARVDSRDGEFGTHPGETHIVSLEEGTHTIEYRNVVSLVGPSGWLVSETLTPFTGAHPCGIEDVELICRPLNSPNFDLGEWTSKTARHCYFLVTQFDETTFTYGAYNDLPPTNTLLTPDINNDPFLPPGGCGDEVLQSICEDVDPPPDGTLQDIVTHLENALDIGPDGTYNAATNNSNLWIKERIIALSLGLSLPPSAPTNEDEFCAQVVQAQQNLEDCGVPQWLITRITENQLEDVGVDCP